MYIDEIMDLNRDEILDSGRYTMEELTDMLDTINDELEMEFGEYDTEELENRARWIEEAIEDFEDPEEFGTGDVVYTDNFPETVQVGRYTYKLTEYTYTDANTGMLIAEYDRPCDYLRVYMDAAGHIWDEHVKGCR